jgi:hypothetical protein
MISIYVFLTLVSHLTGAVNSHLGASQLASVTTAADPLTVSASFKNPQGVRTGMPVVADGDVVGKVTRVQIADQSIDLQLTIVPEHRDRLQQGVVALISTPLSKSSANRGSVVELIRAQDSRKNQQGPVAEGAKIRGFDSFEQFWKS